MEPLFLHEDGFRKKRPLGIITWTLTDLQHTVDGSEIPRPTTWDGHKTRCKSWDSPPTSTGFHPRISGCHQQYETWGHTKVRQLHGSVGSLLSGSLHWVLLNQIKGVSIFVSHLAISFIYRGRVTYVTWKSWWGYVKKHLMMYICRCRYLFAGFFSELSQQTWNSQKANHAGGKKTTPNHLIHFNIHLHCFPTLLGGSSQDL